MDKQTKKRVLEMYLKGTSIDKIALAFKSSDREILAVLPKKALRKIFGGEKPVVQPKPRAAPMTAPVVAVSGPARDRGTGLGAGVSAVSDYASDRWCHHCGTTSSCDCRARLGLPARAPKAYAPAGGRGDRGVGM